MKKIYAILVLGLMAFAPSRIQTSTPQSLPFAQDWTTTTLITVDDDWSGVPGIVGYRGDALTAVTGTDPQTIIADGSATPVDVNANRSDPNIFATGGVTEFDGIVNPVVALTGSGTADAPHIVIYLNTTCMQNINVAYNLRDIDGSVDNAVQPVALQYRVGTSGNYTNVPAGFVADATTGPSLATLVTPVNVTLPAACDNQTEVQVRIITANAVGNDEWVGIDDINITGTPFTTWLGTADAIWSNPANWSCGLPTLTTDVVIPPGTPNPVTIIPGPITQVHDLTVQTGAQLISQGNAQLDIYGDLNLQGQFQPGSGSIYFRGTGSTFNVPPAAPSSFFDVFFDVQLPALTMGPGTNIINIHSFTLLSGSLDATSFTGQMSVTGDWVNNSGASAFTPGTGTVELAGTGSQSIGGSFQTTFYDLIINNTGSGVSLGSNVNVNALTFTAGKVTLGSNNLAVETGITGSSSTRYVVTNGAGALRRAVSAAGTYLFPVGTASTLEECSVNFAAPLGAANTLAARFISGSGGSNGLPLNEGDVIDRTSVIGYWEIIPGSAFADTYTGTFIANGFGDIQDYTKLHLLKRVNAASPWVLEGTHVITAGSNALATLQRTGMSGFSQFGVGGEQNVSLPVKFSNVKAYQQGSSIKIDWSNLTESNVVNYVVERSANGSSFTALNTIDASRNDGGRADYTFLDVSPLNGVNFYRIRSNELDGKLLYSVIVKVNTKGGVTGITVYPNPVTGGQVSLQTTGFSKGLYTVRVFDAGGQQVFYQLMNHNGGAATEVIQLPASLKPGMYNLQLSGEEVKLAKPFIIR